MTDQTSGNPGTTGTSASATGPPGSTTSTDGSSNPTSSDNPPSSNHQDTKSDATANQSGASNSNVSAQVGQGGDTGSVKQGNQASSEASSTATGSIPQSGSDPSATATAATKQDSPTNSNVNVLVGTSGNVGSVSQQNNAQADASAAGTTTADGTGGGGVANASATQTSPGNLNLTVRVGSPGDNGPVNQQNTVGAQAGPNSTSTTGSAPSTDTPATTDQSVTTSNAGSDVTNDGTVDQELIQTQDGPGPNVVGGAADAVPLPTTSTGSANATQTGAYNVNVSIRVASPGSDGGVAQTNSATATGTSPDLGIAQSTDGSNYNLSIVLPGKAFTAPGNQWQWNWTWTGDGTPPAGASADAVAPTSGSVWNWTWTSAPPDPTQAGSATTPAAGTFTWTFTWLLPNGKTFTITQQQACDCNWTWNWTWDWSKTAPDASTGAAPSDGSAPADAQDASFTTDNGPITQWNSVDASALASTDTTVTPLYFVDQTGADPTQDVQLVDNGQSFVNDQAATAITRSDQIDPSNLNSVFGVGIPIASITQANVVSSRSVAMAVVSLDQELIQGQDATGAAPPADSTQDTTGATPAGTDGTAGSADTTSDGPNVRAFQWLGAQQTTTSTQHVVVQSQALQSGASNVNLVWAPAANQAAIGAIEQLNSATTTAAAISAAWLTQQLAQFEDATGSGVESIDLTQLLSNQQTNGVYTSVAQSLTRNLDNLLVPAGSRATNPTLRQRNVVANIATSENWADLKSVAFQYQGGAADIEVTSALQQIQLTQSGASSSPTASQNRLLNQAGWLGVEPPLPPSPPPAGTDQGGGDATGTTSSVQATSSTTVYYTSRNAPPAYHGSPHTQKHGAPKAPFLPPPGLAPAPSLPPLLPSWSAGGSNVPVQPPASTPGVFAPPALAAPQPAPSSCSSCPSIGGGDVQVHPHSAGAGAVSVVAIPSQGPSPWFPSAPSDQSAGSATSGSAPSTGSGQTAIAFGPYRLAAPLVTGPRVPTPVLGRPVIFLDPFERPG